MESAERKQTLGFGKKVQAKKTVNDFEAIKEEEESEEEFRKPVSGRSSRSVKRVIKTPVRPEPEHDDENLLNDYENHQTPSILGSSGKQSNKTRMGSTDEQGNRLSNMPGEERPSLTSVTPYDDDPEVLVQKVEDLCQQAR